MPDGRSGMPGGTEPSPWVRRFLPLVSEAGTVLDVAAGGGRHTRLAARVGHDVLAVDRDIGLLADLATDPGVEVLGVDLEVPGPPPFAGRRFDGVVVTNYLHRPLLDALVAAVAGRGVLIYETFAVGNERFGRPTNPDYLLRRGELLAAVRGVLTVLAYEDRVIAEPRTARVQRICAVGADHPDASVTEPRPGR